MTMHIWLKRFLFLFRKPKYCVGDLITLANVPHTIIGVRRNWKYGVYFYRVGANFSASESIVDYFNLN